MTAGGIRYIFGDMLRSGLNACAFLLISTLSAAAANSAHNFGGVGIDGVPQADGQIVVRQLVEGGPAHRAGIHNGDVITNIDGKATKGSNFQEMVEFRLRGKAGTRVALTIQRPGGGKALHFTLIRQQLLAPKK